MSQTLTKEAVAAHKKPDDLWIIVDDDVYDLTKFQTEHPGRYSANISYLLFIANHRQAARKVD